MNELLLESYKYWENRDSYLNLMEKFISNKINGIEFENKFLEIWAFDRDWQIDTSKLSFILKSFEITKLEKFSVLISLNLFLDVEIFEANPLFREEYEIDENELRERVKKIVLKIKDL